MSRIVVLMMIPAALFTASASPADARRPKYKVVSRKDLSYSKVVRVQFRIVLPRRYSRRVVRRICRRLIALERRRSRPQAISFFFYRRGTKTAGAYTAARADWAPFGRWSKAHVVRRGDYSRHRLKLVLRKTRRRHRRRRRRWKRKRRRRSGLSRSRRIAVFVTLVRAQDRGVGDTRAYYVVARTFRVPVRTVRKIAVEGLRKGWLKYAR